MTYFGSDRLGSFGKYYPWGQEKPSATTNNTEKFTAYFRDSETGLDYAINRYHQPGMGRFMTADPYMASGGPAEPGSWNRYAYTRGDPVNRIDYSGLDDEAVAQDGGITFYDDVYDLAYGYYLGINGGSIAVSSPPSDIVGSGGGGAVSLSGINDARQQIEDILKNNPLCYSSIGATSLASAIAKIESIPIAVGGDIAEISYLDPKTGTVTYAQTLGPLTLNAAGNAWTPGQAMGGYIPGYGITLNSYVDWNSATTIACSVGGGNCSTQNLANGLASAVGASSMTPEQFLDMTLLHEMAHSFGIAHDSTNPADTPGGFNTSIWMGCFQ